MGDVLKRSQLLDLPGELSIADNGTAGSRTCSQEPPISITSRDSSPRISNLSNFNGKRLLATKDDSRTHKRTHYGRKKPANTICEACRNIDFGRALSVQTKTLQNSADGIHIAKIGALSTVNECSSCRLFSESRIPQATLDETTEYEFRAYSFLKYNTSVSFKDIPSKLRAYDMPFFAVTAQGFDSKELAIEAAKVGHLWIQQTTIQPPLLSPRTVPPRVSFSYVASLLEHCKRHHRRLCGMQDTALVGMQVIDCQTMSIIAAPKDCVYAALSYVWGGGRNNNGDPAVKARSSRLVLKLLPRVVSDAITVTRGLHLRYLWVDKYCIDQDNADEKHDQISRMDAIYQGAELTIIAAAGKDENFGLPGVGTTPRIPQPIAVVRDFSVVSTMPHPHMTIQASKWATRGWTYQEAVLSRRRLVFTETQTYFECNAMNCNESVHPNFDLVHTKDKQKALRFMHSGIFTGTASFRPQDEANGDIVANAQSFLEHIQQYSRRDLSFDTDSFKAFAGIASHFERTMNPIPNAWGLPMLIPSGPNPAYVCTESAFYWKHTHDVWSGESKPRRREGFPSWSWVGWAGEVDFNVTDEMLYQRARSTQLLKPPFEYSSAGALHLRVVVVISEKIKMKDLSSPSKWLVGKQQATLSLSSEGFGTPEDISTHFDTGVWKLVKILSVLEPFLLVIHQKENQNYERVGLMTVETDIEETRHLRGWRGGTFVLHRQSYEQLDLWLE